MLANIIVWFRSVCSK